MTGKKLNLGLWHRFVLSGLVGNLKDCSIAQARTGSQILDLIQVTDEEATECGVTIGPNGALSWQKSEEREFFFNEEQFAMLKPVVESHRGWRPADWKLLEALLKQMEEKNE